MGALKSTFAVVPPGARHRLIAMQYRMSEGELRRLRDFVPADKTAVDVGGWWGPWTYWLSRRATAVHTFEPVPHVAQFLQSVSAPNVTVHNFALSDAAGEAVLHVPSGGPGSEGRSTLHTPGFADPTDVTVQLRTLDSVEIPGAIGFVKIDVEGHEAQVLKGALDTISTHRPVLLVEVEAHDDRPTNVEEVVALVEGLGYSTSFLRRGRWLPFTEFDVERDQRALAEAVRARGLLANMVMSSGYINNFLFRPKP
ncbi:FkbM family methyltransferase [Blastococcus sp. URHD0036]|uniref:FkbM family methyltransferase n=1 Tax=Blastococcus sp. URHD0036 TaxID=1380356 RepID=UPI00068F2612|nr:FkbM family methyltransferase [Blastococcus sp. URHD0036]